MLSKSSLLLILFSFFTLAILILALFLITRTPETDPIPSPSPSPTIQPSPSPSPSPSLPPSPSPSPFPLPSPSPFPSPSPSPKPSPSLLLPSIVVNDEQLNFWFEKYAQECNVSQELLKYIAMCESKMNPQVINGPYAGLFQFSANTWVSTRVSMATDPNPDLRLNAEEAIRTAAFKISHGGQRAWVNCLP